MAHTRSEMLRKLENPAPVNLLTLVIENINIENNTTRKPPFPTGEKKQAIPPRTIGLLTL